MKLEGKLLEMYLYLHFQAINDGFESYLDYMEYTTPLKDELEELKEIQKQIDKEIERRKKYVK